MRFLTMVVLFICVNMAGMAKPMIEPKVFENCISSYLEGDFLIINIQTNRDPSEYSLHTVYLFRRGDNEEQTINDIDASTFVEKKILRIKINRFLIKYEEYSIRVFLNNEKRARMEFYI